jgi:arylsulfatase A
MMKQWFLIGALLMAVCAFGAERQKPNVVIIYGDDVGFGDVGVYGATMIPTPNIDRFAAEGLRFTDAHCSAATCTPSRFSMLTGIYGFRHKVRVLSPNAPLCIPTDILTLPKLFKQAGYTTGVIGKWHLGIGQKGTPVDWNSEVQPGPLEIGFDYSFLLPSTNDRVPCVYLKGHRVVNLDPKDPLFVGRKKDMEGKKASTQYPVGKEDPSSMTYYRGTQGHDCSVINGIGRIGYMAGGKSALWNGETMADVFVDEAKAYIAAKKDQPFFLYFASQDVHVPRTPHPRFKGKSQLGYRGDAMVQFDWSTGEILKTLEKYGLTENTIVIFSSDNGPVYDDGYEDGTEVLCSNEEVDRGHDASGIWRGGKYQIYEGGTRVPFIIRWPGQITPGVSDALVNQIDFIASFAGFLGVELSENDAADSRNLFDAFIGKDRKGLEFMLEESFGLAFRRNEWKYVQPVQPRWGPGRPPVERALYNLKEDPSETKNVIADHPEIVESMEQKLDQIVKSAGTR